MSDIENTTGEEIEKLMSLAHDSSKDARAALFDGITDLIEAQHQQISITEIDLMMDILSKIICDIEVNIRKKLALKLADRADLPAELIILLANDEIEVANPILLQNTLLTDKELVRIIQRKSRQHQLSIAARKMLSSDVCRELVRTDDDDVIVTLLSNQEAKIDNDTIEQIVEKSKTREILQSPLVHRQDLPKHIAARMYSWISMSLKSELMEIHSFTEEELEEQLESSIKELKKEDNLNGQTVDAEVTLIAKLKKANKLHISFLMKSLRQGNTRLFELAFAEILNVPEDIMCNILYERGPAALAIACCAARIDKSVFLTMFRLTREAKMMDTELSQSEIEHTYSQFVNTNEQRAKLILHKWVEDSARTPIF
ncbi:DUF2336 domain-containing protein [Pseudemcibacter aquimaris]|uniref:DUF2336 domain-containing protein n=1 Tax=Pseudemcibacter aquimaris TaxID=2857064 RepID=UPI0020124D44|nr:DUF2336 domain-containing protein [Pseudemcibacter aquimaris]MCC3860629.1 DUF2336 domain-containing protein [Pseudemcibacter aquimaris]WDU59448.1 DUF2336 domain-containing protein [Pseudemcibacter aquimaris]